MATIDSGTFERTALAAWVAIARHTGTGDIPAPEAVTLLKNLRAAVFYDAPVVRITPEDELVARLGAPPEKEIDHA